MVQKKNVLILCTGNSCRSQMAEGVLRYYYGDIVTVYSAGTQPSHVNEYAIAVMKELGIDISEHYSKSVHDILDVKFDIVITVCSNADENCPVIMGDFQKFHWGFEDPVGQSMDRFREVRDLIVEKFKTCSKELQY
tara:strand:- start:653 stop:1060 length:408 start_codon:yes stop_codon:yes gene_type:complete